MDIWKTVLDILKAVRSAVERESPLNICIRAQISHLFYHTRPPLVPFAFPRGAMMRLIFFVSAMKRPI